MNKSKESPPSVHSLAHHCVQAMRQLGWALQLLFSHVCSQLQQDLDENRFLSKYLMPGSVIKTLLGSYPTT